MFESPTFTGEMQYGHLIIKVMLRWKKSQVILGLPGLVRVVWLFAGDCSSGGKVDIVVQQVQLEFEVVDGCVRGNSVFFVLSYGDKLEHDSVILYW